MILRNGKWFLMQIKVGGSRSWSLFLPNYVCIFCILMIVINVLSMCGVPANPNDFFEPDSSAVQRYVWRSVWITNIFCMSLFRAVSRRLIDVRFNLQIRNIMATLCHIIIYFHPVMCLALAALVFYVNLHSVLTCCLHLTSAATLCSLILWYEMWENQ